MNEKIIARFVAENESLIEEAFAAAVQDGFDIEELAEQVMIEHYSEIEEAIKAAIAGLLGILPF